MARIPETDARRKRHARLRKKVSGTPERPRLLVRRTLHHIYAIVVDDARGHTLAAASTRETSRSPTGLAVEDQRRRRQKPSATAIAAKAKAAGIAQVVFDRGGYKYHGRVRALADAAREAGLEF